MYILIKTDVKLLFWKVQRLLGRIANAYPYLGNAISVKSSTGTRLKPRGLGSSDLIFSAVYSEFSLAFFPINN
jgi:hypothetical protein